MWAKANSHIGNHYNVIAKYWDYLKETGVAPPIQMIFYFSHIC